MGRILVNVPAPVPAQPLSVNMRCVISINGLGVSVAKAKDKSIEGLLTWVPITATIMNKAIDMIAAIPQGPISNRRIAIATISVAMPQTTAK